MPVLHTTAYDVAAANCRTALLRLLGSREHEDVSKAAAHIIAGPGLRATAHARFVITTFVCGAVTTLICGAYLRARTRRLAPPSSTVTLRLGELELTLCVPIALGAKHAGPPS